jgi:FKBP-type peptidyl-prolyl cis-trans isomerase
MGRFRSHTAVQAAVALSAAVLGLAPLPVAAQDAAPVTYARPALDPRLSPAQVFIASLRGEPGMQETASGLLYFVIQSGPPEGERPTAASTVRVHYEGTFMDGAVFDSSRQRGTPAEFPLRAVIPGWTEVVQLMRPGDVWTVFLKPELAYGRRGAGQTIPPDSALVFRIELLGIVPPATGN